MTCGSVETLNGRSCTCNFCAFMDCLYKEHLIWLVVRALINISSPLKGSVGRSKYQPKNGLLLKYRMLVLLLSTINLPIIARANSDIFVRAFKDKREFDHWLERKSSLPPRPSDLKSHWSSLLKGCICPFEPPFVALPQCEPWNLSGWPLTVLHIWVDLLLAMLMSQL